MSNVLSGCAVRAAEQMAATSDAAMQWAGNYDAMRNWFFQGDYEFELGVAHQVLRITDMRGDGYGSVTHAAIGDWIIKAAHGRVLVAREV